MQLGKTRKAFFFLRTISKIAVEKNAREVKDFVCNVRMLVMNMTQPIGRKIKIICNKNKKFLNFKPFNFN